MDNSNSKRGVQILDVIMSDSDLLNRSESATYEEHVMFYTAIISELRMLVKYLDSQKNNTMLSNSTLNEVKQDITVRLEKVEGYLATAVSKTDCKQNLAVIYS